MFARKDKCPKQCHRGSGNHLFQFELFPVVPVDAWLRLFVDTLKRHPIPSYQIIKHAYPASSNLFQVIAESPKPNEDTEPSLSQAVQSLSITSTVEEQTTAVRQLNYPPHIIENIEAAMAWHTSTHFEYPANLKCGTLKSFARNTPLGPRILSESLFIQTRRIQVMRSR